MNEPKIRYKNKIVYLLLSVFFTQLGIQKLYAGRVGGFIWWWILIIFCALCDAPELIYLFTFIDLIVVLRKSREDFLVYTNKKYFKGLTKENRYIFVKELLKRHDEEMKENLTVKITPDPNQVTLDAKEIAIKVPGEEKGEGESHNHIKEDPTLKEFYDRSQAKLDRFQNNNYFPSVDSSKTYDRRSRSDKVKELKEELKSGLISKEDYNEALRKL